MSIRDRRGTGGGAVLHEYPDSAAMDSVAFRLANPTDERMKRVLRIAVDVWASTQRDGQVTSKMPGSRSRNHRVPSVPIT